ncbi:MAG: hypothetical protein ACC657_17380 [Thiohalomonadales bacterium]
MSIETEYNDLVDNAGCVSEAIIDALHDTVEIKNSMTLAVYLQNYLKSKSGTYVEHIIEHEMAEFLVKITCNNMIKSAAELDEMGPY